MQELSLCQSIGAIVSKHAAGREVQIVRVRIGRLRQVVPDTLVYCWNLVSEQTDLAGSRLEVESIPAAIHCAPCDHRQVLTELRLVCESCGGTTVEVVAGEELLVTSLELAEV